MIRIDTAPSTVFTLAQAEAIAAGQNADPDNDGWTWTVRPDPLGSGRAVIDIHDDDGEFVATL